jgi:Flp pilus assembly protein TadD
MVQHAPRRTPAVESREPIVHDDGMLASRNRSTLLEHVTNLTGKTGVAWLAAILVAATVLTYSNHFRNGFFFDDLHVVVENSYVRDIGNVPLFFTDPATKSTLPTNRAYRPILMVTLAIDYWLAGGLEPFYFHLSTFLWFLVLGGVMYMLYVKIFDGHIDRSRAKLAAILAVGWFWLHTANAETINYVTARSDSLSTLCVVLGLVLFAYTRSWRQQLALIPVAIGMFIKSTALMYVPIVFLYSILFEQRLGFAQLVRLHGGAGSAVMRSALKIAPQAVVLGFLFWVTLAMTPDTWDPGGASKWAYLITQPWVICRYLGMFFLPVGLSADTDWVVLPGIGDARFAVGVLVIVALIAAAAWLSNRERWRPVSFGIAWFFLALAPSSSLIPLAEVTNDHRVFFPFVGLVAGVVWTLTLLAARVGPMLTRPRLARYSMAAVITLTLAAHAYGAHCRNQVWSSAETLWHDVTLKSPKNGRGLMNYGVARMSKGDFETADRYFTMALDTGYANHAYLQVNLAIVNDGLGRPEQARNHFAQALRLGPDSPTVHYYYGKWLNENGNAALAVEHLDIALSFSPGMLTASELRAAVLQRETPDGLLNLGLYYFKAKRFQECLEVSQRAVELRPDAAAYNNLCSAYNGLKMWDEAIAAGRKALELQPEFELAKNNLQWALDRREQPQKP